MTTTDRKHIADLAALVWDLVPAGDDHRTLRSAAGALYDSCHAAANAAAPAPPPDPYALLRTATRADLEMDVASLGAIADIWTVGAARRTALRAAQLLRAILAHSPGSGRYISAFAGECPLASLADVAASNTP